MDAVGVEVNDPTDENVADVVSTATFKSAPASPVKFDAPIATVPVEIVLTNCTVNTQLDSAANSAPANVTTPVVVLTLTVPAVSSQSVVTDPILVPVGAVNV